MVGVICGIPVYAYVHAYHFARAFSVAVRTEPLMGAVMVIILLLIGMLMLSGLVRFISSMRGAQFLHNSRARFLNAWTPNSTTIAYPGVNTAAYKQRYGAGLAPSPTPKYPTDLQIPHTVYHGTNFMAAMDILNNNRFKVGINNRFWTTTDIEYAWRIADERAKKRNDKPAVLDLSIMPGIPVNLPGHPVEFDGAMLTVHIPNASSKKYFTFGGIAPAKVTCSDGKVHL